MGRVSMHSVSHGQIDGRADRAAVEIDHTRLVGAGRGCRQ